MSRSDVRPHTIVRITDHEPDKADYSGMTGRLLHVNGSRCIVYLTAMGVPVDVRTDHIEPLETPASRQARVDGLKARLLATREDAR